MIFRRVILSFSASKKLSITSKPKTGLTSSDPKSSGKSKFDKPKQLPDKQPGEVNLFGENYPPFIRYQYCSSSSKNPIRDRESDLPSLFTVRPIYQLKGRPGHTASQ